MNIDSQNEDTSMVNEDELEEELEDEMEEECYEYDYMNLYQKRSSAEPYRFVSAEKILDTIRKDVEKIMDMMGMGFNWCFEIYEKCGWNIDVVYKMLGEGIPFREFVHFSEEYEAGQTTK